MEDRLLVLASKLERWDVYIGELREVTVGVVEAFVTLIPILTAQGRQCAHGAARVTGKWKESTS